VSEEGPTNNWITPTPNPNPTPHQTPTPRAARALSEAPSSHHHRHRRHSRRPATVSIVIAALLVVISAASLAILFRTGLIPARNMYLLVPVDILIVAGVAALLLFSRPRRHKVRFTLAVVLSVLLAAGNTLVAKAGIDYMNFGHGIQPTTETVLYDVVVLKDGPSAMEPLAATLMGLVKDDPLTPAVEQTVDSKVKVNYKPMAQWPELPEALKNKDVQSIVINDALLQLYEDQNPDDYANLKIIWQFPLDVSLQVNYTPKPVPTPTPIQPHQGFIIYVSGIDTAGPVSTRSRSDVNQLIVVNPATGKILLVNTPRDFYVQLRGTTGLKDKLTHAGVYGIDVSVGTMEDLFDINIDYYVRVNFTSLVTVIDALGGVDVVSDYNFSAGGYTFTKGVNHLTGDSALAFSRERHAFPAGDRVRGQNQQRVIEAIIGKLTDPSVLVNYARILSATQNAVQTSMPQDVLSSQIQQQLSTNKKWEVTRMSVDGSGNMLYTYTYPGQLLYVMVPYQETVDAAKAAIKQTLTG